MDQEIAEAARELMATGFEARAVRVLQCGRFGMRRCHDRYCPRCAAAKARRNSERALFACGAFQHPAFLTLTLPSRGPFELRAAVLEFRQALLPWRRSAVVTRALNGGVGQLEPHLDRRRTLWAVHAHVIVDARSPALEVEPLAEAWAAVTDDRGRLLVPPDGAAVRSPAAAAAYVTKKNDWSPTPGALPRAALRELITSLKARRVFIAWGTGRRRER